MYSESFFKKEIVADKSRPRLEDKEIEEELDEKAQIDYDRVAIVSVILSS